MVEALARLVRRLVATCLSSLLVLATASARLLLGLLLLGVLVAMMVALARLVIRLLLTAQTRRLGRGRAANLVIFRRRRRLILTCRCHLRGNLRVTLTLRRGLARGRGIAALLGSVKHLVALGQDDTNGLQRVAMGLVFHQALQDVGLDCSLVHVNIAKKRSILGAAATVLGETDKMNVTTLGAQGSEDVFAGFVDLIHQSSSVQVVDDTSCRV